MARKPKERPELWIKFSEAVELVAEKLNKSIGDKSDWGKVAGYFEKIPTTSDHHYSLILPNLTFTNNSNGNIKKWNYLERHFNIFKSSLDASGDERPLSEAATLLCAKIFEGELNAYGVCEQNKVLMPQWVFDLEPQQGSQLANEGKLDLAADGNTYTSVMFEKGELNQFLSELGAEGTNLDEISFGDAPTPKTPGRPGADWKLVEQLLRKAVESDPEIVNQSKLHVCRVVADKYNLLPEGLKTPLKPETIRDKDKMQPVFEELGFGQRSTRKDLQNRR